jgi:hypothetical protein
MLTVGEMINPSLAGKAVTLLEAKKASRMALAVKSN